MNYVALLTARKGSKLKDKCFLKLKGKECINYVIEESKKTSQINEFYCSSDSEEILKLAKKLPVTIISNVVSKGYSNCKRLGLIYAIKKNYQKIILIDSDGEHSPDLIKKFIQNFKNPINIIFGKRKINRFSEKIICKYYKIIYGVSDILCGMIALKTSKIKKELLFSSKDDLGMEIILDILRKKNKFTEINVFGKERIKNSRIYVNFYSKFKYGYN